MYLLKRFAEKAGSVISTSTGYMCKNFFISCAGNVESALTLLPIVVLFLSVLQLGSSALARVVFTGEADASATQQSFYSFDGAHTSNSFEVPLQGGGSVLMVQLPHSIPSVSPLLPGGDNFTSTGMSVQ
jgi:hypothetical protein